MGQKIWICVVLSIVFFVCRSSVFAQVGDDESRDGLRAYYNVRSVTAIARNFAVAKSNEEFVESLERSLLWNYFQLYFNKGELDELGPATELAGEVLTVLDLPCGSSAETCKALRLKFRGLITVSAPDWEAKVADESFEEFTKKAFVYRIKEKHKLEKDSSKWQGIRKKSNWQILSD